MKQPELKSFVNIVSNLPPGRWYRCADILRDGNLLTSGTQCDSPSLKLYCDGPECKGVRFWDPRSGTITFPPFPASAKEFYFRSYTCRHCKENNKVYSLMLGRASVEEALIYKLGEFPGFAPHTPSRVLEFAGPDREYYLLGRRAESQSMGIAAFAYYRRVVENQKGRLLSQIIKVAKTVGSPVELLDRLRKAEKETQFHKAIGEIKPAVPESLLLKGMNPLMLLHSALSEGLHSESDEECLELAQTIRVVLASLTERMEQVMAEENELGESVGRLIAKHAEKKAERAKAHGGDASKGAGEVSDPSVDEKG